MCFRLVPKSATLNDFEGRIMAVTLCYFTEFGKPVYQHITASICGGIYARVYCILVRVRCRRKESSRSLSHLDLVHKLTIPYAKLRNYLVSC